VDGSAARPGSSAFGALGPAERKRLGRFGGILLATGSLASIPAGMALEPAPAITEHALAAAGVAVGLAIYFLPWTRISSAWLHVSLLFGTFEVALGVAQLSDDFAFYLVVIAAYAAYILRSPASVGAYAALFGLALLAPLVYDDENLREQIHHILVTLPVLAIVVLIVRYLRDTLERREREHHEFAQEAVQLAVRIRARHKPWSPEDDIDRRLEELARASGETEPPHRPSIS